MSNEPTLEEQALADSQEPVAETPTVRDMVETAVKKKLQIADLEEQAKALKKDVAELEQFEIPKQMNQIGTGSLSFVVGNHQVDIALEHKFRGSLNAAPDTEEAVKYLVDNGFDGALLTKASVDFKEGELDDEAAMDMQSLFMERFQKDVHLERNIHASTLASFARQKTEKDPDFDPKKVGITVMRQAKITIKDK